MFKRFMLLASIVWVAALVLAGFSAPQNAFAADATPTPAPTATPLITDLGKGGTHISFWNGLTGSDGTTLNAMLAQFVKDNPDISVTTEIIPWATLYTKLQAALVAGQPPDMFLLHASEVSQFYSYGALADLSSWYDTSGGPLPAKDWAQPGFDGVLIDGKPYGVQLDNHGRGTWVNLDMLAKAGIDPNKPPTTTAETIAMLQKLTIDKNGKNAADPAFDPKNVVQWGTTVSEWPWVNFYAYLTGNGGSMLSADGKTATVNSQAGIDALQASVDLVYKYHVSPPEAGFDSWAAFGAGKLALLPTGTWFLNQANTFKDIKSAAWPTLPLAAKPSTWFGAHTFMVPPTTSGAKLDAVKKLILWVSEHQKDWAASGQVPARLSVQAALDPAKYSSNILIGKTFTQYGRMEPRHEHLQELIDAVAPEISAALNNQKPVKQALDDAARRMQQILDRSS